MSEVDLQGYRQSDREKQRISSLFSLLPSSGVCRSVLDIGARDGHISSLLAERFPDVTALDLELPVLQNPAIRAVKGDVTALQFEESAFDLVLCSEVLEHIPPARLQDACDNIRRVAAKHIIIGVPFKQDLRRGRTTCTACGAPNPAWGHVNSFDQARLEALFRPARLRKVDLVGQGQGSTNAFSAALMDWAGNPWGNYHQQEPCMECGANLTRPDSVGIASKLACRIAYQFTALQNRLVAPGAMWIHCAFEK